MLLRFVSLEGDNPSDPNSIALLHRVDKNGVSDTEYPVKLPLWVLGSAFESVSNFHGFLQNQGFELEIKPVKIKVDVHTEPSLGVDDNLPQ